MSRTDRLLALVEAAIDLLADGDLDGARAKLDQARRIDPQQPDLLLVQAGLAASEDDLERAFDLAGQAVARAPDDVHVLLGAADLALLVDTEQAVAWARSAADLVDEEDELVTAVLILADGLCTLEKPAEARAVLAELSSAVIDEPIIILDVAYAHLGADDPTSAELWLRRLTSSDDEYAADAWYAIGQCREAKGDRDGMIAAWKETRRRDAALPATTLTVSDDQLEEVVSAALDELPAEVHAHLTQVPILIDDLPAPHLVEAGWDPRLLGLFEGTPLPEQSAVGGVPSITTIHLYRKNLERYAGDDPDLLADEIRITVLHETAHYFGLDDDDLERLGLD